LILVDDLAIGIDIGGTKIIGGVVDASGSIIDRERRDTPNEGGMVTIERIAEVAAALASRHQVSSLGVSLAGFISKDRKRMETNPNSPSTMSWSARPVLPSILRTMRIAQHGGSIASELASTPTQWSWSPLAPASVAGSSSMASS